MTVDIEKAFDSINHCFLFKVLEKYGFEKDFIKWIKILLQNQESCIINGGTTTNYFKLEKGTRQGDPISAYLFILVLEIVFLFTKESKKNKRPLLKVNNRNTRTRCEICSKLTIKTPERR